MSVLRVSARGVEVKNLQSALNKHGYKLGVDGIFGHGTLNAVLSFQRSNGLVADGLVGKATWEKLLNQKSGYSISPKGIELIKSFEGYSSTAYDDGVGVWTIGWGTVVKPDGSPVKKGDVTNVTQATQYLQHDLDRFERAVNDAVKVPLTQNQYDALVSFTYNVGISAMRGSTALRRLNAGDYKGAADALLSWNKGRIKGKLTVMNGLTRRRNAERDLFLKN